MIFDLYSGENTPDNNVARLNYCSVLRNRCRWI